MGEVTCKQFVQQIDRPENIVNDKPQNRMVVIPANHERVEAQNEIYNAFVAAVHFNRIS
jgi:hypothetical protein